ncbi:MAG: hypothetical protein RMK99_14030 [Anaerolineales bacterium]|nr:hypothetical protein [Anaerolineales bacterium]
MAAIIAVAAATFSLWRPPAALVEGDAWDYRLTPDELPAGWTLDGQSVLLPHNLAAAPLEVEEPVVFTNLRQLYSARYTPPPDSPYAQLTLEVLIYNAVADAQAAMNAETLDENWKRTEGPAVGEQSVIWQYRDPTAVIDQNLYRVDFRYRNAIASVVLFGQKTAVPDANEAIAYARRILAKLQSRPIPTALQQLQSRQLPDLRPLLLMSELPRLDPDFGERWEVNPQHLGAWTENEDFDAAGRAVLERLGRLGGYQLYLLKPLSAEEQAQTPGAAYAVFQQISVYGSAENAPRGLDAMIGLSGVTEAAQPPAVGDRARLWSTLLTRRETNDTIAITEVNFVVGRYVATMQVQTAPLPADADQAAVLSANQQRAVAWAQALAEKLQTVRP